MSTKAVMTTETDRLREPEDGQPRFLGRAGVVGGGIAGLGAAIALRRAGWHVEVFERSQFKSEVGAAISVPPNATLILDRWGFNWEDAAPVPNQATRLARANDFEVINREEYPNIAEELGHVSWSLHRVDLHQGLRKLATSPNRDDGRGFVEMKLGCEVVGLDCEQATLTLADGRVVTQDLIIIADGAHSQLVQDLTGHPTTVIRTGRSIYRWLVATDDVMADPDLRANYAGELPGFLGWHDPVKEVFWVTYTCRGGKVLNNAVVHSTQAGDGEHDQWYSPVTKSQVLEALENFHPSAKKIVDMASEDGIKVHHLFSRPPLTSFVRGRTAVIGDAAHVMLPTHAAGGSIAIESAASIETLFKGVDGRDEAIVKQRLRLFDKLRIPRCNLTMLASNAGPEWLDVPGLEDEIRRFYSGPLPPAGTRPWTKEFRELLFHHNEYGAAEHALAAQGA